MGIEELVLRAREHQGEKRGLERGMELGKKRALDLRNREVVTNMIRKNLSVDMIADFADVPLEYVQKIKSEVLEN